MAINKTINKRTNTHGAMRNCIEYADKVMAVMPMWSIVLVIAGIFICAIIGGMIGKALLKKHFVKAGIV